MFGECLCLPRLNGGGVSLERTRLCAEFPDLQGKYRELLRARALRSPASPEFLHRSEQFETNSLLTRTGNRNSVLLCLVIIRYEFDFADFSCACGLRL
jgi:hypothetical protein